MDENEWIEHIELKGCYLSVPIQCPYTPKEIIRIVWDQLKKDME